MSKYNFKTYCERRQKLDEGVFGWLGGALASLLPTAGAYALGNYLGGEPFGAVTAAAPAIGTALTSLPAKMGKIGSDVGDQLWDRTKSFFKRKPPEVDDTFGGKIDFKEPESNVSFRSGKEGYESAVGKSVEDRKAAEMAIKSFNDTSVNSPQRKSLARTMKVAGYNDKEISDILMSPEWIRIWGQRTFGRVVGALKAGDKEQAGKIAFDGVKFLQVMGMPAHEEVEEIPPVKSDDLKSQFNKAKEFANKKQKEELSDFEKEIFVIKALRRGESKEDLARELVSDGNYKRKQDAVRFINQTEKNYSR